MVLIGFRVEDAWDARVVLGLLEAQVDWVVLFQASSDVLCDSWLAS
jgi:hypothetical protein